MSRLRERLPPGVVIKYYVYTAANGPGFIYPIYVLYLLEHGITFTQLGLIGATQSVVVLSGEIPTGYVGDRVGRRNSLALGQVLYAASTVGLLVGEGFGVFLLAFAVMSLGRTFISGSGSAWLYDTLQERLDEDQYTHVRGQGAAIGQWVTALTMVLGGVLYVISHTYPFYALLGMRITTFATVLWLPKTARYASRDAARDENTKGQEGIEVHELLPFLRNRVTDPSIRAFVAYMTVVFGVVLAVDPFIQPIAVESLQAGVGAVLMTLGIPEPATLGVLYASFTGTAAIASGAAGRVEEALGTRTLVVAVPAVLAGLMILPVAAPVVALPMFFSVKSSESLLRPVAEGYLNDRIESAGRATILSAVSMVYGLGRIPFVIGSGIVGDVASPVVAVATLGGALLVGGGAVLLLRSPVDQTHTTTSETTASN